MEQVRPIVLAGGKSRRFGRDKLGEPISRDGATLLIDRPIAALRAVFGPVVLLVGRCDAAVAARSDGVIDDDEPGAGPMGGIVSALSALGTVFVLPGDLPAIVPAVVRRMMDEARRAPDAWAVWAWSDRPEPCVGVYRIAALPQLRSRLAADHRSLHDALPAERVVTVPCDPGALRNVNTPADMHSAVSTHEGGACGSELS